jgi:hypothetical protein
VFTFSFTKLNLIFKQLTSIADAGLKKCHLPPYELTANLTLPTITDPQNVTFSSAFFTHLFTLYF